MSWTSLPGSPVAPLPAGHRHRRFVALLTVSALVALAVLTGAAPASAAGPTGFVTAWGDDEELLDIPPSLGRTGAVAIAAGDAQGLAITPAGTLVEWRTRFSYEPLPRVLTGKTVTAVAASGEHSVALTSDGKVVVWGYNSRYLDDYYQVQPPAAMNAKTTVAIAAGGLRSMALTSDGQVWSWGESTHGEDQVPSSLSGKAVTAIAAGDLHDLALTSNGRITAWGDDTSGQTRVPPSLDSRRVTAIAAGTKHNLALTSDGRVIAWGDDAKGQTDVPSSLDGTTVIAISAGGSRSMALTADGGVVAWGDGADGLFAVPTTLEGQKVTAIAAGSGLSLALTPGRAPVVASSPAPVTVEVGETASFSASATGLPTASVQWQRADDGGAFEDVPGATRTTFALVATRADDGARFRAVFTNAYGTATTGAAPLRLNRPPTAAPLRVTTGYGSAVRVRLPGSDPDGDALTYLVSSQPTHGTLTGTAPDLTYTPAEGYEGPDAFTYRVRDRTLSSSTGTVAITVSPRPNTAPVARGFRVTALFGSATAINLAGTDADGDPLTYAIVDRPGHGELVGAAPTLTYVPADGFSGSDSFTYRVNDGRADSATVTVSLTVAPASCVAAKAKRDVTVVRDERDRDGRVRSARFGTSERGELLLAHVAANGSSKHAQSVTRVRGGGLTWTRVQRENGARGTSEIWQAYAPEKLRSARVEARLAVKGHAVSLVVVGFSRTQPGVGSSAHATGVRSVPRVSLTPAGSGSLVWAVGRAPGSRYRPQPLSEQKVVHATTSRSPRAGSWVQRTTRATEEGTPVVVGDRKRAARWGYVAVEVRGGCRG